MDKKFLDKVVDQIVDETIIDYDKEKLHTPFRLLPFLSIFSSLPLSFLPLSLSIPFSQHCKVVYGLNDDEIRYVWNEYRNIIKDKIENNGL